MDTKLNEYLSNVVALEKAVYTQQETINRLKNIIRQLGIPLKIDAPLPPTKDSLSFDGTLAWALVGAVVLGIFNYRLMFFGAILGFGFMLFINYSEVTKTYNQRMNVYNESLRCYERNKESERQRLKKENLQKENLQRMLKTMEEQLHETRILLRRYYLRGILFEKYQNLVAVCSIYEYFLSGRCTSLTGHEGAYNIFESEVRFERIYTKLDEIVTKLDDIKQNQYVLYDAIQEGNRATKSLVDASIRQAALSERIADSSALSAYYSKQTALEVNQLKWLKIHETWKNQ